MHIRAGWTWYAYQTWTICVHINLYAYRLCPICVLPALVCISDMDNMCTHKFICISSVSDMCTTCSGMHIIHVRYVYQVLPALVCISDMDDCPLYTYRLCTICIPEQVVL